MFRIFIFILAGITFANFGWNLGQFLLTDLRLRQILPAEPIVMACVSFGIATGMVLTELLVSHPFRNHFRKNAIRTKNPILFSIGFGLLAGAIAGIVYFSLNSVFRTWSASSFRLTGWLLVAFAAVVAESFTWKATTIEASDNERFWTRFGFTLFASLVASWATSVYFEGLRQSASFANFKRFEAPIGFMLLGTMLGLAFSICTAPSYVASLRAAGGFEFKSVASQDGHIEKPLRFVGNIRQTNIEEGLTIQLPAISLITIISSLFKGDLGKQFAIAKDGIAIGSSADAHIRIKDIEAELCRLIPKGNSYILSRTGSGDKIAVNGSKMTSSNEQPITHNTIITLYAKDSPKFYRFVYYNRFLDPLS